MPVHKKVSFGELPEWDFLSPNQQQQISEGKVLAYFDIITILLLLFYTIVNKFQLA